MWVVNGWSYEMDKLICFYWLQQHNKMLFEIGSYKNSALIQENPLLTNHACLSLVPGQKADYYS